MRKSKIRTVKKETLQEICNNSNTILEVLEKLGYKSVSGNIRTIKDRFEKDGIDLAILEENRRKYRSKMMKDLASKNEVSLEDILVKDSPYKSTGNLKKKLFKYNILHEVCIKCGGGNEWNGEQITLQLDHINGDNTDNRLENLRILCPNCHSQTHSWCGRKPKNKCVDCGMFIDREVTRCKPCFHKDQKGKIRKITHKFTADKKELEDAINSGETWVSLGERYGVTDNAVKKRAEILKIDIPTRRSPHGTVYKCNKCENLVNKGTELCRACFNEKISIAKPSKEELIELLKTDGIKKICQDRSRSENTVRGWCKEYGIKKPTSIYKEYNK